MSDCWNPLTNPSPEGEGNLAQQNCLYSAGLGRPSGIGFVNGFEQSDNVVAKGPVYVDRRAGDYRLRPGSNCGAVLADVGGAKLRAGPR